MYMCVCVCVCVCVLNTLFGISLYLSKKLSCDLRFSLLNIDSDL